MANNPDNQQAHSLIQRIDARLQDMGKTRYWLSKEVTDGRNHGIITDIDRKGTMPRGDRLRRIAEVLDVSIDYLVGTSASPAPVHSEVGVSDNRLAWGQAPRPGATLTGRPEQPIPVVGTGDCATLAVSTNEGRTIDIERSSFDPDFHVRYIARPPALSGARDLYAIYFHGDSMVPRFEPGEVGIVDPRRPVGAGDYVVVQLRDGSTDDVGSVLVKRLVRQTTQEVWLEQFNPALTFALPREEVVRIHRIVPNTELLF